MSGTSRKQIVQILIAITFHHRQFCFDEQPHGWAAVQELYWYEDMFFERSSLTSLEIYENVCVLNIVLEPGEN